MQVATFKELVSKTVEIASRPYPYDTDYPYMLISVDSIGQACVSLYQVSTANDGETKFLTVCEDSALSIVRHRFTASSARLLVDALRENDIPDFVTVHRDDERSQMQEN